MRIPDYMIEQLETNLRLFEEREVLAKKIRPEKLIIKRDHNAELLRVLWHAICSHEYNLQESIENRRKILEEQKKHPSR